FHSAQSISCKLSVVLDLKLRRFASSGLQINHRNFASDRLFYRVNIAHEIGQGVWIIRNLRQIKCEEFFYCQHLGVVVPVIVVDGKEFPSLLSEQVFIFLSKESDLLTIGSPSVSP